MVRARSGRAHSHPSRAARRSSDADRLPPVRNGHAPAPRALPRRAFGGVAGLCYLPLVRKASGPKLLLFDLDGTILQATHAAPPFEAAVRDVFDVAVESQG